MQKPERRIPGTIFRQLMLGLTLVGATACVTHRVVSGEDRSGEQRPSAAQAKAPRRPTKPGKHHGHLKQFVGEWKAVVQVWEDPAGSPTESRGSMNYFWLLDGRFLGQEYKGESRDHPYDGLGAIGYDRVKKKYCGVWLDTASTAMTTELGDCDGDGKVFTFIGVEDDPATGRPVRRKSVRRVVGKDKHVVEQFREDADGRMMKVLAITFTRK